VGPPSAVALGLRASGEELTGRYAEAVGLLAILQGPGTRDLPPGHPSATSALDEGRFLYELGFFREHYIAGLCGLRLDAAEDRLLRSFFQDLATAAAAPRGSSAIATSTPETSS